MSNKGISLRYVKSPEDPILTEVHATATEFFGSDNEDNIEANDAAARHALSMGALIAVITDGDTLVGWSFSFPISRDASDKYMDGRMSENEMFWNPGNMEGSDTYLASVFVKPDYRDLEVASMLLKAATENALKGGGSVVYSEYTDYGKKISEFFRRSTNLNTVRMHSGLSGGNRVEVKAQSEWNSALDAVKAIIDAKVAEESKYKHSNIHMTTMLPSDWLLGEIGGLRR